MAINKEFLKEFGTTVEELELAKFLSETNQHLANETEQGTNVGFEYNGQFISNIFMDETGRFELTLEEAVEKYGASRVSEFYHEILKDKRM